MKFDLKTCKKEYELFGEKLYIAEWTLRQRLEIAGMIGKEAEEVKDRYEELLYECLTDSDGNKVSQSDLLDLPFSAVNELHIAINTVNGINAKKVEELVKNSEATLN